MEMLQQSAILTVLGMTVVFIFLWIMIICIITIGKIIHKAKSDEDAVKSEIFRDTEVAPEVIAAISASVIMYKEENQDP